MLVRLCLSYKTSHPDRPYIGRLPAVPGPNGVPRHGPHHQPPQPLRARKESSLPCAWRCHHLLSAHWKRTDRVRHDGYTSRRLVGSERQRPDGSKSGLGLRHRTGRRRTVVGRRRCADGAQTPADPVDGDLRRLQSASGVGWYSRRCCSASPACSQPTRSSPR